MRLPLSLSTGLTFVIQPLPGGGLTPEFHSRLFTLDCFTAACILCIIFSVETMQDQWASERRKVGSIEGIAPFSRASERLNVMPTPTLGLSEARNTNKRGLISTNVEPLRGPLILRTYSRMKHKI